MVAVTLPLISSWLGAGHELCWMERENLGRVGENLPRENGTRSERVLSGPRPCWEAFCTAQSLEGLQTVMTVASIKFNRLPWQDIKHGTRMLRSLYEDVLLSIFWVPLAFGGSMVPSPVLCVVRWDYWSIWIHSSEGVMPKCFLAAGDTVRGFCW